MSELRWKWMKPDKPGVWCYSTASKECINPSDGTCKVTQVNSLLPGEGWWCFLCDLPTIQPPLPELRLPAGWSDFGETYSQAGGLMLIVGTHDGEAEVQIRHTDDALRIRAVQAAIDILGESHDRP